METSMIRLSQNLRENVTTLQHEFSFPANQDFVVRTIAEKSVAILFLQGLVKEFFIEEHVAPLLTTGDLNSFVSGDSVQVKLQGWDERKVETVQEATIALLQGRTLILIDGDKTAYSINTAHVPHRNLEKPEIEDSMKGPKEAFIESSDVNRALIRKQLPTKELVTEKVSVGDSMPTSVYMMYIRDIANPALVENIKERVSDIQAEHIQNLSILEQYIEERPYSLVPTTLVTERPDRAVSFLKEGHVVLLMDSSSEALITPVTFWSFFHTAEDYYQRWAYGNLMRLVRLFAFFIALFLPATYIAVTNYHVEAIPTELLFTIAATRETVPFPAIFELILIELTFDIVREAGLRMPFKGGPVVSLLAALILTITSVQAGIASPVIITVVGLASLASYTIPTNSFNFTVRITRFGFIGLASVLGFFGIAIGVQACVAYLASVKSFGVPFISPMAPHTQSSKDLILRPPVWKMWLRPMNLSPLKKQRGEKVEKERVRR
ncbi:spore germination protein [Bacillus fonticola]|uniref:spore germination protein n=1 Tax=Bacillus fonticola TaxID=2728853 RepID=UPI0014761EB7|nr:spore germination protein [Bacillus fonticola]